MTYDPEYTRAFYNSYGDNEWQRLEDSASGRLKAVIHEDFLARHVSPGSRVLDAGAGPGRFSAALARRGALVTVLDISDTMLELARRTLETADMLDRVEAFVRGDICDLSAFPDDSFDAVVCYGGALSYVCDGRHGAAAELVRVTRPGGTILVSVMSRTGAVINNVVRLMDMEMLREPDVEHYGASLWPALETGRLDRQRSRKLPVDHPAMYLYTAAELGALFPSCEIVETAGSNVTIEERQPVGETIAADAAAWETLVELEKRLNRDPGLVDAGNHIIMVARKPG